MSKMGHQVNYPHCHHSTESLRHAFWECQQATQIWKRILRILVRTGESYTITWGMAAWASLCAEVEGYDFSIAAHKFKIRNGRFTTIPTQEVVWEEPSKNLIPLWELLSSQTLWIIWKGRNKSLFENKKVHPVEAIQEFGTNLYIPLKDNLILFRETRRMLNASDIISIKHGASFHSTPL